MSCVTTNKARCQDCHRCIRVCPVKAIGLRHGQCWVVAERCILCGACLRACPQKAKLVANATDRVRQLIAAGRPVVASLAPSYPAAWSRPGQLVAALRRLGFTAVEETAVAAAPVAETYRQRFAASTAPLISACCPVVVELVESRFPSLIPYLAPSASPMVAHASDLAQRRPEAAMVFIGPCIAKMQEAQRTKTQGRVAAVLTFDQLASWLAEEGIDPAQLPEEQPDLVAGLLATFPLTRGIRQAAGLSSLPSAQLISVDGLDGCLETLSDLASGAIAPGPVFFELLACRGGCIGGSGLSSPIGLVARHQAVVAHARECPAQPYRPAEVAACFAAQTIDAPQPTDEQMREILSRIGKRSPADEKNCGGCGYSTCREKAIAVHQGLAEPEMCVPYMKAKFETLAHAVVDSSLSGVVIVNGQMEIQEFNPAANRMFNPGGLDPKNHSLGTFLDPADFQRVWERKERIVAKRVVYPHHNLVTSQTIYPLENYGMVVGLITDITDQESRAQAEAELREKTVEKATAVIKNQMRLAQEIAGLLGEATSESKATLLELVALLTSREEG